jgi:HAD superfamily hydrolase (TIGR01484 family)
MRSLDRLDAELARDLDGIVFDLDDTVLDHGALGEHAYAALFRLRESGLALFACTGRPAGWAEVVARQWPVDAAIAENGAIAFVKEGGRVTKIDACSAEERTSRRDRLRGIATEVLGTFEAVGLADDNDARISDVTFDIGEHRHVPRDVVSGARALIEARGARTFVSSVHLHATLEGHDKASGAVALLARRGVDASRALGRYAYVGDSENDAAAFAAFRTTFGVANVRSRVGRMTVPPRFVATAERGEGFSEIARRLVALRG